MLPLMSSPLAIGLVFLLLVGVLLLPLCGTNNKEKREREKRERRERERAEKDRSNKKKKRVERSDRYCVTSTTCSTQSSQNDDKGGDYYEHLVKQNKVKSVSQYMRR